MAKRKRPRSKHLWKRKRLDASVKEVEEVTVETQNFGALISEGLERFEEHYRQGRAFEAHIWSNYSS